MPISGRLDPMTTLARRLKLRKHDVVFIGVPEVEPFARAASLDFVPFCGDKYQAQRLLGTFCYELIL
jgi:UDP:flavonoid glycosyltransferase YjiC (YdhE family)